MKALAHVLDSMGERIESLAFSTDLELVSYNGAILSVDSFLEIVGPIGSPMVSPEQVDFGLWAYNYDPILTQEIAADRVPRYDRYASQEYDGLEAIEL